MGLESAVLEKPPIEKIEKQFNNEMRRLVQPVTETTVDRVVVDMIDKGISIDATDEHDFAAKLFEMGAFGNVGDEKTKQRLISDTAGHFSNQKMLRFSKEDAVLRRRNAEDQNNSFEEAIYGLKKVLNSMNKNVSETEGEITEAFAENYRDLLGRVGYPLQVLSDNSSFFDDNLEEMVSADEKGRLKYIQFKNVSELKKRAEPRAKLFKEMKRSVEATKNRLEYYLVGKSLSDNVEEWGADAADIFTKNEDGWREKLSDALLAFVQKKYPDFGGAEMGVKRFMNDMKSDDVKNVASLEYYASRKNKLLGYSQIASFKVGEF